MTIDITPEAVELKRRYKGTTDQLVNALRSMPIRGGITGQCIADEAATVIETLSAALAASKAETAAAYEVAAQAAIQRKGIGPDTMPHPYDYGYLAACDECAASIRALPTTFTNAELLTAAMQLPEVRALVDAAKRAAHATTNDGITGRIYTDEAIALQYALAPFMKGGE